MGDFTELVFTAASVASGAATSVTVSAASKRGKRSQGIKKLQVGVVFFTVVLVRARFPLLGGPAESSLPLPCNSCLASRELRLTGSGLSSPRCGVCNSAWGRAITPLTLW